MSTVRWEFAAPKVLKVSTGWNSNGEFRFCNEITTGLGTYFTSEIPSDYTPVQTDIYSALGLDTDLGSYIPLPSIPGLPGPLGMPDIPGLPGIPGIPGLGR